jgi:large subunit ribosomal protein L25
MEARTIEAKARPKTGKGVARRLRTEELVPAVCYGRGREPQALAVNPHDLTKALDPARGWNTVLKLKIVGDGGGSEELVLVKDYQVHPIKRDYLHFDFLAVRENEAVLVEVPVILKGKPEGVKEGGILQQLYRKMPVQALPFAIPDKIEIEVSHLKLGQAIHLSDVKFPEGVKTALDGRTTICNVVAPKEEKAPVEEAAAEAAVAVEGAAAPAAGAAAPAAAGAAAPAKGAAAGAAPAAAPDKAAKKEAKK